MRIAVIGAGWAGLSAAVHARQAGHSVVVYEASSLPGGRARSLMIDLPDGRSVRADNGQHILIGAYSATLALMKHVGVDVNHALLRRPLSMRYPDGAGLELPRWPSPWDALAGVLTARGWTWAERWSLLRASLRWQLQSFRCPPHLTVADLCADLAPKVMDTLIEPLCVSALNTPADRSSAEVFLRVLRDSLFGGQGASNLLLPTVDLGTLLPEQAVAWLESQGCTVRLGHRIRTLQATTKGWDIDDQAFDQVILATSASNAVSALKETQDVASDSITKALQSWAECTAALEHEAIATVYTYCRQARLPRPMIALHSAAHAPAQFVFDRGQLGGPAGLWAFVVSASQDERQALTRDVLDQAREQLASWLGSGELQVVQTVVDKRATFACTPGLRRPRPQIAPGLWACGDYVEGPYPATLEGAVRSGALVIGQIGT